MKWDTVAKNILFKYCNDVHSENVECNECKNSKFSQTLDGRSPSRFPRGERPRHNGTVRPQQTGESRCRTFSCGRSTIHCQSVNIYLHTFLAHFSDTIVLPPLSRMWRKGPVTCFYIFMIRGQLRYSIVAFRRLGRLAGRRPCPRFTSFYILFALSVIMKIPRKNSTVLLGSS